MKVFIKAMKALSDPNRMKIIKLQQLQKVMCVYGLQGTLDISLPSVSKKIPFLSREELVRG